MDALKPSKACRDMVDKSVGKNEGVWGKDYKKA